VRLKSRPRQDGLSPERVRDVFLAVLGEVSDGRLRAALQDKFVEALESV
jgi:hypothetical protein